MTSNHIKHQFSTRRQAAAAIGVSRQRLERLIRRWPQIETDNGIDIERLRELRDGPQARPYSERYVGRGAAGKVLGISRQRVQKLLKRFPEAVTADGVDTARLQRLRLEGAVEVNPPSRGLSLAAAAAYVGLTVEQFQSEVSAGAMPPPRLLAYTTVWDRLELDRAIDAAPVARE